MIEKLRNIKTLMTIIGSEIMNYNHIYLFRLKYK